MAMISIEDLKKLQESTQHEIDESTSNNSDREKSKYPIVYPGVNGKLVVRLLYNMKFGGIQRKIIRHTTDKSKVPCLQVYGEDCPICSEISQAEELRGKECGVRRKYGYKVNGICYAQVIESSDNYFKDRDINIRDVVIMMYPKTVYNQINHIIVDSGEKLEKLVCENDGLPIQIERSQKSANAIPEYKVSVYPWGTVKSFSKDNCTEGKTEEDMFQDMLSELPNLAEDFVPVSPNEEVRNKAKALGDVIRQEYVQMRGISPNDTSLPDNKQDTGCESVAGIDSNKDEKVLNTNDISSQPVQESSNSNMPECFGNHGNSENKCVVCPYEVECCMQ